ncbi:MAG: HAD family hydrolase [Deltaproteobacteria bacterium]|nr:HAD family hydrolase [Deltaproteobacteria bacterium]
MLVAIDFDGVIVDSLAEILSVSDAARIELGSGREPGINDIHSLQNLTFQEFGRQIGVMEGQLVNFENLVFEQLKVSRTPSVFFAGMKECLVRLATEHTLVIVTSNITENVKRAFTTAGLDAPRIFAGPTLSKTEKIQEAMAETDFATEETIMVGDGVSDIRAAKVAGVRTIAVTWGFHPESILALEKPDFIAHSPVELMACLGIEQLSPKDSPGGRRLI